MIVVQEWCAPSQIAAPALTGRGFESLSLRHNNRIKPTFRGGAQSSAAGATPFSFSGAAIIVRHSESRPSMNALLLLRVLSSSPGSIFPSRLKNT